MHDDDELSEVYDAETIAALDAWAVETMGEVEPTPLPSRLTQWSRTAALGAVLSGVALGLQEVLDPKEQRQIVIEVDDEGQPAHLPVELFLDPDSPAGSLCIVHRSSLPTPSV